VPSIIFRKGLELRDAVAGTLNADYHSALVERVKAQDYTHHEGRLTVHLAREFGFCYGVDRAVDYAYQARRRFPDRPIHLAGEIIHNPHVNGKLRALGIQSLDSAHDEAHRLGPDDVVILPAFGVTVDLLLRLQETGCTLVDTTCGSVLNVWKTVRRYAQDGFTAIIHGKVHHEETRATASQTLQFPGGRYLIVLNREEAAAVCDYIRYDGSPVAFMERFGEAASSGFDPAADLGRIGLANQTTMLMSESVAIGDMFREAMQDRYGDMELEGRFRTFETICSATEDRQQAVITLIRDRRPDLMVVIGGYNSSNTSNLARICAVGLPTFHIADASCLVSPAEIRHHPVGGAGERTSRDWLPGSGPVAIGLTAGASTPDIIVGQVIETLGRYANASPGG
jgi:4-hydroxy-3-methylbut-2-en-1-yl diphosphate reductase